MIPNPFHTVPVTHDHIAVRRTLFLRLAILSTLLVLFSVGPCAFLFIRQNRTAEWRILENQVEMLASTLAQQTRKAVGEEDDPTSQMLYSQQLFTEKSPVVFSAIVPVAPEAASLVTYRRKKPGGMAPWMSITLGPEWRPQQNHLRQEISTFGDTKGEEVLVCTQQIERPAAAPIGWVHVGISLKDYKASISESLQNTLSTVILSALAGIIASFFMARQMTRPVKSLCAMARRLAGGDLSARGEYRSSGEMQQLTDDMNWMAESLLSNHNAITKNARILEKANATLLSKAADEELLSRISADFMAAGPDDVCRVISESVAQLGARLGVDAAGIYLFSEDRQKLHCETAWLRSPEVRPPLKTMPASILPRGNPCLLQGNLLTISNADSLGSDSAAARDHMQALGIRSLAISSLGAGDQISGFLFARTDYAELSWESDHFRLHQFCAGLFSSALARREAARDREKLHEQLLQSQKMEAVGKLSGGIAHDFNNMLVPIIGYSDAILQNAPQEAPWLEDIREIKRAAESAASLTRQLLTFSRKQIISRSELRLNTHIQQIEKMLRRVIGENIQLRTHLDPELWTVCADSGQIDQCLVNLCVNARYAMPGSGSIDITTRMFDSEDAEFAQPAGRRVQGLFVRLSVADTGCGMDEATLSRIFEPFYSTKGSEGTGLGLSVVHGVIEQHGGWVTMASTPGKGTTFHLWLPALSEPSILPPEPEIMVSRRITRGDGQHILLIEDEKGVLAFVSAALRQNGYRVTTAECGRTAREIYQAQHAEIDLVMSDVVLPDASGVDLLEEFYLINPNLKSMLSSGYSEKAALLEMVRRRDLTFLHKPYTLSLLLEAVRSSLHGESGALLA